MHRPSPLRPIFATSLLVLTSLVRPAEACPAIYRAGINECHGVCTLDATNTIWTCDMNQGGASAATAWMVADPTSTLCAWSADMCAFGADDTGTVFCCIQPQGAIDTAELFGTNQGDTLGFLYTSGASTWRLEMAGGSAATITGFIYGGPGGDTITGSDDGSGAIPEELWGEAGADIITGNAGTEYIDGGIGADTLDGSAGDDEVVGDDGNDSIRGGAGNDVISGGSHDDAIAGNGGDDTILGNNGVDIICGDSGTDYMEGNGGDDTIYGPDASDTEIGGPGTDTCDVSTALCETVAAMARPACP